MPFLKDPLGTYSVGAVRCVVPVEESIIVGKANIPSQEDPGLRLEEVAFTVFYPTDVPSGNTKYRKGLRWLAGPLNIEIEGFRQFSGVSRLITWFFLAPFIYAFGQFIKIPVYQDAPLLHPQEGEAKWSLVILSHGLGGSPTAYSQLCARLAASGKVVCAMEHRDGTSPVCIAPYKGQKRPMFYIKESEVRWAEEPQAVLPLRVDQLIFRQHEIYIAYAALAKLITGSDKFDGLGTVHLMSEENAEEAWSNAPINIKDICLAGHSFGGCTSFSILSSKPPLHPSAKPYPRLPVRDMLILDPWLEPVPSPGPTPFSDTKIFDDNATLVDSQLNSNASEGDGNRLAHSNGPRLLVMNSEAFSLWKTHFERLEGVVKCWRPDAKLVTLVRSAHTSFSDYHVFPLTGDKASARLLDIISQLSVSFLDHRKDDWSVEEPLKNAGVEILYSIPEKIVIGKRPDGSNRHKWAGEVGQIVVH